MILSMNKRGQLGLIELKFFFIGFGVGLILALILVLLGSKGILPFKIPFVCGSILFGKNMFKKGQLMAIEFHFFLGGLAVGIILALVLIALGSHGVLPFKIPLVCAN